MNQVDLGSFVNSVFGDSEYPLLPYQAFGGIPPLAATAGAVAICGERFQFSP